MPEKKTRGIIFAFYVDSAFTPKLSAIARKVRFKLTSALGAEAYVCTASCNLRKVFSTR